MLGSEVFIFDLDETNFNLLTPKYKPTRIFTFSIMLEFELVAGIANYFSAKIRDLRIF